MTINTVNIVNIVNTVNMINTINTVNMVNVTISPLSDIINTKLPQSNNLIRLCDLPFAALQLIADHLPIYKVKMFEHIVRQQDGTKYRFNIPIKNMSAFLDTELAPHLESCYSVEKSNYIADGNIFIRNERLSPLENEYVMRKLVVTSIPDQLNEIIGIFNEKQFLAGSNKKALHQEFQPTTRAQCSVSALINIVVNYYLRHNKCISGSEHSQEPFWYFRLFAFLDTILINHLCICPKQDAALYANSNMSTRVKYYKSFLLKYSRILLAIRVRPLSELKKLAELSSGGRIMIDCIPAYIKNCASYNIDKIILHHGQQIAENVELFGLMPRLMNEFPRIKIEIFTAASLLNRTQLLSHYIAKKCNTYADYI